MVGLSQFVLGKRVVAEFMDRPTSVVLLVFSLVFVIVAITHTQAERYVGVAFLTLFYALANHFLMLGRKHETIGKILASTKPRLFILSFIEVLLFGWWVVGVITLIQNTTQPPFQPSFLTPWLNFEWWSVAVAISMPAMWVLFAGIEAWSAKQARGVGANRDDQVYSVLLCCENCNFRGVAKIPKGASSRGALCPVCSFSSLEKPRDPHST